MGARPLLRPRAIPRGATVGVCAPSGPVNPECVAAGVAWLEAEGLRVRAGRHLHERRGYLAGDDTSRASDLLELVGDPGVDAIVLARGGYGLPRLLDTLDPRPFRRARKPIVGYSDATALLLWLRRRAGLTSVHGPMLERSDTTPTARARLIELLRGGRARTAPLEGTALARGRAAGPLVGGNLKMLCASLGTSWEIDTRGAILFFEEVNEQPYAIDRMLVQLRSAGKLGVAAGVAVGALVGCESERYPEVGACDVLRELLPPSVNGPVVIGLPFGHVADNRALGSGVAAVLDGRRGPLSLEGPVVEGKS
jgi:muramoyltetrapeptide carboxypeptidase